MFSGGATVNISGCTFSDNEAEDGGAIFAGGSTVVIINSTFNGNYAEEAGGGIYNDESEVSVTNATFSGNQAPVVIAGAVPADHGIERCMHCYPLCNNGRQKFDLRRQRERR